MARRCPSIFAECNLLTHRNRSVQRGRELNWPVAIQLTTRDLPSPLFRSQYQRSLAMDERLGREEEEGGRVEVGREGVSRSQALSFLSGSLDNEKYRTAPFSADPDTSPPHQVCSCVINKFARICHLLLPPLLKLSSSSQLSAIVVASYRFHLNNFRKFHLASLMAPWGCVRCRKRAFRIIFLCSAMISRGIHF